MIATEAAGEAHARGLVSLFEAAGSPCFCRFWHFEGNNNAWLARCAESPGENRDALVDGLARGSDDARGVVALDGDHVVGWAKVAPAAAVPKLYDRRLYRGLPCFAGDRAGVFTIGCFLVHPGARRRGVATALVAGAVRLAPLWGARSLECFPRRPSEPVSDEELWTGAMKPLEDNGFVAVTDFAPYPVMRRELG